MPALATDAYEPPFMSSKSKNVPSSLRGKRYTLREKAEVLDFVDRYNAEHGRGGQTAATRKFQLSALSISSWRKQASQGRGIPYLPPSHNLPIGRAIAQMQELHERIVEQEQMIQRLKAQFNTLKTSL
ncbi:hypothetical protein OKA05_10955 [Luteolibacter arcticus]|uniref:Transposase n=1 Tax=Luteolibacter arcticus TaxID=1581411 RepID=A0ABT3GHT8_9BACT|nr:hypothetical protein [Luteolibacter arcticus]MCW1923072.1 hypothetical protein [Luteolibacter arcticus]